MGASDGTHCARRARCASYRLHKRLSHDTVVALVCGRTQQVPLGTHHTCVGGWSEPTTRHAPTTADPASRRVDADPLGKRRRRRQQVSTLWRSSSCEHSLRFRRLAQPARSSPDTPHDRINAAPLETSCRSGCRGLGSDFVTLPSRRPIRQDGQATPCTCARAAAACRRRRHGGRPAARGAAAGSRGPACGAARRVDRGHALGLRVSAQLCWFGGLAERGALRGRSLGPNQPL